VYGRSPLPLREEFVSMDLDTPYQVTKMLGELYCNFYRNFYGLQTVRARLFNSYGPGEIPGRYRNVIPNFIYWAMQGQPLPITGSGEETRDWTFVGDVVEGLLRAGTMKEAVGEAFNVASGRETRVIDVARWINEETGNTAGVRHLPRREWDAKDRVLASIEKAGSAMGYEPATDVRDGLRQTVEWFRAHWSDIQATVKF
jgi:nucleoside-diphosphate-sugar epimerase